MGLSKCIMFGDRDFGGVEKNCYLGGMSLGENPMCVKCKKGWMVLQGICIKQIIDGCLEAGGSGGYCDVCDGAAGYFSLADDGVCARG